MLSGIKTTRFTIKAEEKADQSLAFRLVNKEGDECESILTPDINRDLSKLFNGAPKYVSRSSGGISLVSPTQALFVHLEEQKLEIRIRVVFRELERDSHQRIISKKIVHQSKTVLLSDVREGLISDIKNAMGNFCVDFGMGLIPIHVFKFHEDPDGVTWALFVCHDELERALVQEAQASTEIMVYQVPIDLLRQVESQPTSSDKSFQWAKEHAHKLVARGETLVPEFLQVGIPCTLAGQLNVDEIRGKLLDHLKSYFEPSSTNIFYLEQDLIPLDESSD